MLHNLQQYQNISVTIKYMYVTACGFLGHKLQAKREYMKHPRSIYQWQKITTTNMHFAIWIIINNYYHAN